MGILSGGGGGRGGTTGFATAFMPGRKDSKKKIMVFSLFLSRARGLRQGISVCLRPRYALVSRRRNVSNFQVWECSPAPQFVPGF